jgi:hypothetical protein
MHEQERAGGGNLARCRRGLSFLPVTIPAVASGNGLLAPFYLLLDMYSELTTKP